MYKMERNYNIEIAHKITREPIRMYTFRVPTQSANQFNSNVSEPICYLDTQMYLYRIILKVKIHICQKYIYFLN